MTNSKILYYAVNGSGQSCIFTTYPVRDEHFKTWVGEMVGMFSMVVSQMEAEGLIELPILKWSDEPVELELSIKIAE